MVRSTCMATVVLLAFSAILSAADASTEIEGRWRMEYVITGDKERFDGEEMREAFDLAPNIKTTNLAMTFKDGTVEGPGPNKSGKYTVDPNATPHRIIITQDRTTPNGSAQSSRGIFKIDGDQLTLAMGPGSADHPTSFEAGNTTVVVGLRRVAELTDPATAVSPPGVPTITTTPASAEPSALTAESDAREGNTPPPDSDLAADAPAEKVKLRRNPPLDGRSAEPLTDALDGSFVDQLVIEVSDNGSLRVNSKVIELEDLLALVTSSSSNQVLIQASPNVKEVDVMRVLEVLKKHAKQFAIGIDRENPPKAMIAQLPTLPNSGTGPSPSDHRLTEVFRLRQVDVSEAGQVVQELFSADGDDDLRFTVDERANSIVAHGTREKLDELKSLLTKLDTAHDEAAAEAIKLINEALLQQQVELLTLRQQYGENHPKLQRAKTLVEMLQQKAAEFNTGSKPPSESAAADPRSTLPPDEKATPTPSPSAVASPSPSRPIIDPTDRFILDALTERYEESERAAASAAAQWRTANTPGDAAKRDLNRLRAETKKHVGDAYSRRLQAQLERLKLSRAELDAIEQRLLRRHSLADRIIDRRVEELLSGEDLSWLANDGRDTSTSTESFTTRSDATASMHNPAGRTSAGQFETIGNDVIVLRGNKVVVDQAIDAMRSQPRDSRKSTSSYRGVEVLGPADADGFVKVTFQPSPHSSFERSAVGSRVFVSQTLRPTFEGFEQMPIICTGAELVSFLEDPLSGVHNQPLIIRVKASDVDNLIQADKVGALEVHPEPPGFVSLRNPSPTETSSQRSSALDADSSSPDKDDIPGRGNNVEMVVFSVTDPDSLKRVLQLPGNVGTVSWTETIQRDLPAKQLSVAGTILDQRALAKRRLLVIRMASDDAGRVVAAFRNATISELEFRSAKTEKRPAGPPITMSAPKFHSEATEMFEPQVLADEPRDAVAADPIDATPMGNRQRDVAAAQQKTENWIKDVRSLGEGSADKREQALAEVVEALNSDNPTLQFAALKTINGISDVKFDKAALRTRILELMPTIDGEILVVAFYALYSTGHTKDDLKLLQERLQKSHDPSLDQSAAHLLFTFGDKVINGPSDEIVLGLLHSGDRSVRRESLRGLWGALVSDRVAARMIELVDVPESHHDAIYFGLSTLPAKNPAVVEKLIKELSDADWNNWGRALWGLGYGVQDSEQEKVAAALLDMYKNRSDPRTRQKCDRLIRQYGNEAQKQELDTLAASNPAAGNP